MNEPGLPEARAVGLANREQVGFLVQLGVYLTVCARASLSDENVRELDGLNELQHTLLQQALHLHRGEPSQDMEGFFAGMREIARTWKLRGTYEQALHWALQTIPSPAPA